MLRAVEAETGEIQSPSDLPETPNAATTIAVQKVADLIEITEPRICSTFYNVSKIYIGVIILRETDGGLVIN